MNVNELPFFFPGGNFKVCFVSASVALKGGQAGERSSSFIPLYLGVMKRDGKITWFVCLHAILSLSHQCQQLHLKKNRVTKEHLRLLVRCLIL